MADSEFFLTQPFKTDDLKAQVVSLRDDLVEKDGICKDLKLQLEIIGADLKLMEEKTDFLQSMLERTFAVFTPPPVSAEENAFDFLTEIVYSKLSLAEQASGVVGGVAYLAGRLGPGTLRMIGKIPKLGGAARLSKAATFGKVAKLGKRVLVLSAAIFVVEGIIKLVSAKEINRALRKSRDDLLGNIREADAVVAEYREAIAEATKLRDTLLVDAGAADVQAYVRVLNESIADVGRQKAYVSMARKMLRKGMPGEMILQFVDGMTEETLADIAQRLEIEKAIIGGEAGDAIAQRLSLTAEQVATVLTIVEVREALIRGIAPQEVMERRGIPQWVLDTEIEFLEEELPPAQPAIEGDGDLAATAAALLVRAECLADLRMELAAKAKMQGGVAPDAVAAELGLPATTIAAWYADLVEDREEVAARAADGGRFEPADLAAELRLPLSVVMAVQG
ncbi:MAG: hypothetical protein AAGE80_05155 [Pseudomonadota bacterium]